MMIVSRGNMFQVFPLVVLLTLTFAARGKTITKTFPAQKVQRMALRNSAGAVDVKVTASNTARVVYDKKHWSQRCDIEVKLADGVLIVKSEDKNAVTGKSCEVHFQVIVPEKIALQVKSARGDVNISGATGDVAVKLGRGALNVTGEISKLDALAADGDIEIDGLKNNAAVQVKTGKGNINLNYKDRPSKGHLTLNSGMGDITVFMPGNSSFKSVIRSGTGDTENDFAQGRASGYQVTAQSATGDVRIKKK